MPLSQEEVDNFNKLFIEFDKNNNGYLVDQDAITLYSKMKIFDNLPAKTVSLAVRGLSCNGEIELSKSILENFCVAIKEQNNIELLRACLCGMTTPRKPNIDLNQALELSSLLGIPKTLGEMLSPGDDIKEFSFSYLANIFYDISIPEDSSQFDGMSDVSRCCYLF